MLRCSSLLASVLAIATLTGSATRAANITVMTDTGSIGLFNLTTESVSGNVSTIRLDILGPASTYAVNGSPTSLPLTWSTPLTFTLTDLGGGTYSISSGTFSKTYGAAPDQTTLTYGLTAGSTTTDLANFLNITGSVQGVAGNPLVYGGNTYDFSPFAVGGTVNIALTGTNFSGGVSSFDALIKTVGASVTGSGSFSQVAVPEPESMALLGIGLGGLLVLRRLRKSRATA